MGSHFHSEAPPSSPPGQPVRARPRPLALPARKPMMQARRVSLFEREVRIRLSPAALEVLFASAAILSEGEVVGRCYGGSTMLTIDLARTSAQVSEACDLTTARNVEKLLTHDIRVHERVRRLAAAEAERLAGRPLHAMSIDVRVRRTNRHFYLDMDVEALCGGLR